jgi:glycerol uptake facilitator-like aquaporin
MTGGEIIRNSMFKLLFEGIGTMFLTIAFNCSQKGAGFGYNQTAMLLVIWVLTIFGWKISGAHYNPCISVAYMLRKDVGSFPRILGVAYAVMQILGAFVGAMISWFLLSDYYGLIDSSKRELPSSISPSAIKYVSLSNSGNIYPGCTWSTTSTNDVTKMSTFECSYSGFVFGAIIAETIGAFFVAFFYLSQTETHTYFSKEKAINCFIIASSYVGCRAMLNGKTVTQSGAVLNPAIAIGTNFAMLFDKDGTMFQYVWIYALFPLAGSILAVIFHEFVFKKTQEVLHDDEGSDENDQLIEK